MHSSSEKLADGCTSRNPLHAAGPADSDEGAAGLDEAVRAEREYLHRRLREELQREPTEEEVDEWLREHTEGY